MNFKTWLITVIAAIVGFFITSALIMVLWNHTIPSLAETVDYNYQRSTKKMGYELAMSFTFLLGLIFGGATGAWIGIARSI